MESWKDTGWIWTAVPVTTWSDVHINTPSCPHQHIWCPYLHTWCPHQHTWCPHQHTWCPLCTSTHLMSTSTHLMSTSTHQAVHINTPDVHINTSCCPHYFLYIQCLWHCVDRNKGMSSHPCGFLTGCLQHILPDCWPPLSSLAACVLRLVLHHVIFCSILWLASPLHLLLHAFHSEAC